MVKARSPTLDTLLMIEKHIRKHDGEFKKKKLWSTLPRKMMYQTFCVAIKYLYDSRKISIDSLGKFGWIYYPHIKTYHLPEWHGPSKVTIRKLQSRKAIL